MKYTLHGFSQQKACELKLGLDELAVLRWFIDFRDTDRMEHREIDGRVYYWVVYSKVLDDLPILKCNARTIANKFKKLEEAEILLHKTFKKGGTFSYYGVGDAYTLLLSGANIFHGSQKIDEGVDKKLTNGSQKIDEGVDKILSYKDSSITYSSIKDSSINNIYSDHCDSKPIKHKYGEYKNVLLTDEELDKLKNEFPDYEQKIENLSSYIESKGAKYKSHLATIRNWSKKDEQKKPDKYKEIRSWLD